MAAPTVESRLRRRILLMTPRAGVADNVRAALPEGWDLVCATEPGAVGGLEELIQFRMVLLDLAAADGWWPVDVVTELRSELLLNVPILCFDGDDQARDEARLARADRFFDRDELMEKLPQFCAQLGW